MNVNITENKKILKIQAQLAHAKLSLMAKYEKIVLAVGSDILAVITY